MWSFRDRFALRNRNKLVRMYGALIAGGVSFMVIRHYVVVGSMKESKTDAKGKTVLITGASGGIGREVAQRMNKKGARVILACRDVEACKRLRKHCIVYTGNSDVSVRHLDLSSMKSIREFAQVINTGEEKIDVLVNNAAVMNDTHCKEREVTEDGIEAQMGINYLGHFLLTRLLMNKLRAGSASRIINITCSCQKKSKLNFEDFNQDSAYDSRQAYCHSKRALVLGTRELARRLSTTDGATDGTSAVSVFSVNPGTTATDLDRHMTYHKSVVSSILMAIVKKLMSKSTKQAAVPILNVALDREFQTETGVLVTQHGIDRKLSAESDEDKMDAKKLWALSEKWTRITA